MVDFLEIKRRTESELGESFTSTREHGINFLDDKRTHKESRRQLGLQQQYLTSYEVLGPKQIVRLTYCTIADGGVDFLKIESKDKE